MPRAASTQTNAGRAVWQAGAVRFWDWFGDGSLIVGALGLACCVVELEAASLGRALVDAPAPDARVALVVAGTVTDAVVPLVRAAADAHPAAAILGPKLREWPSLKRLLELGVTISGTGRRETGLERGEYDQGQHDEVREVLAVNTAGMAHSS